LRMQNRGRIMVYSDCEVVCRRIGLIIPIYTGTAFRGLKATGSNVISLELHEP